MSPWTFFYNSHMPTPRPLFQAENDTVGQELQMQLEAAGRVPVSVHILNIFT